MAFTMQYGWATPVAHPLSATSVGHVLGRPDGCMMRRQGRCPGKEFCADCAWNEGCLVDGSLKYDSRRSR